MYALRAIKHFTLKQRPIQRTDFDEFVELYKPGAIHRRKPTWSDENPEGRWRCVRVRRTPKAGQAELRPLLDQGRQPGGQPDPDILAAEIVEDLQDALEQFSGIAAELATTPAK